MTIAKAKWIDPRIVRVVLTIAFDDRADRRSPSSSHDPSHISMEFLSHADFAWLQRSIHGGAACKGIRPEAMPEDEARRSNALADNYSGRKNHSAPFCVKLVCAHSISTSKRHIGTA